MNLAAAPGAPPGSASLDASAAGDILFVAFNQECSCISVGTRYGYRIFNVDPFGRCYTKNDGGIGIVEMLFTTSLVALVGSGDQPAFSPRRLQITNTKRQSVICELTFITTVLAVRLNRRRLVVVLEEHIYIYDISNMKLIHTIDTCPNPGAICALSPHNDNCYLAYPPNPHHATSGGEILIFDTINLHAVQIVQAHKSSVSCISFSSDGTLLATASDKGTVIRVFEIPSGRKLFQFRRGTYPARIHSLTFSQDNLLLAVSSDTDTIHIFKLEAPKREVRRSLTTLTTSIASSLLPDMVTEMWEPMRDFAYAKIRPPTGIIPFLSGSGSTSSANPALSNSAGSPAPVSAYADAGNSAISPATGSPLSARLAGSGASIVGIHNNTLVVVTSDAQVLIYGIEYQKGGECILLKQHSLHDSAANAGQEYDLEREQQQQLGQHGATEGTLFLSGGGNNSGGVGTDFGGG